MHKSELRANPNLTNHASKVYKVQWRPLRRRRILDPLKSNSKVDSTSYYKESTKLQYPMEITMRHHVLKSVTYYSLRLVFP